MKKKKSVLLYIERKKELALLTDAQAGKLFKAIFDYADEGTEPKFDDLAMTVLFSVFRSQIDAAAEKYADVCRRRSEYGKKGGAPKGNKNAAKPKPEGETEEAKTSICLKKQAKQADTDTVTVTVTDTETDTVTDTDTEKINNDFYTSVYSVSNIARAREQDSHTGHTESEIVECLADNGYQWSKSEIECFAYYNEKTGWRLPLAVAVRRWEARRTDKDSMTDQERQTMDEYLSLVNNFGEEGESDGSGNASTG